MKTLNIVLAIGIGIALLWSMSMIVTDRAKKEKFTTRENIVLRPVPRTPNSETHDVLLYSLGYSAK